jgi:ATP-dependent helicase HrpB
MLLNGRPPLPVDAILPELLAALETGACAVLTAAPGAGKTTRVPPALLGAPWLGGKSIVMLEPRRLAARAAAKRMADERGETLGVVVGYTVRLDRKVSAATRIEVVTEGILARRIQVDPMLEGIGALVFDEFHERSLDGDLGLALALDVQRSLRSDLKILVMSATLDGEALARHLGGAPIVSAPGRVFPVETIHRDRPERRALAEAVARAIGSAMREAEGSVLAFLPGEAEIRKTEALLAEMRLPPGARVLPLYGAMGLEQQDEAIRPPAAGIRKIVLATTIAETSLTIEGVGIVIDSGYKRVSRFDPATGMASLETVRVSLASADQRRGRAGRLGPGVCYRLWPEAENRALEKFDTPEILGADLAPLALELAQWGVADPSALPWVDAPPAAAYGQARDLLVKLEAVDKSGAISAAGKAMARLPLHPRLAHMVVRGKELGAGALAADLAALLSERDILDRGESADIALRLEALRGERSAANRAVKARVKDAARQIRQIAKIGDGGDGDIGLLVALAWPDRIAQARGGRGRFRFAGGGGGALPEHDPLSRAEFLAVATTNGADADQKIYLCATLARADLETYFAASIETRDGAGWDAKTEQVAAKRQIRLGALVLEEKPVAADSDLLQRGMALGVARMGLDVLPWSGGARNLQARVAFLRGHFPEAGWPDLSDLALAASTEDWLAPWLAGLVKRAHLARLDLFAILMSMIPRELRRDLERLAPARIPIPSGAEVFIDYAPESDPTFRARLQEMFGLAETPRIADGRAKLRIELLSPAGRPLAVTQSLESFWTNVYPSVRAEMRGRYPKHKWPDNPLEVAPLKPRQIR